MEAVSKLVYNKVIDQRAKKEFDMLEWADLIKQFMITENIKSGRAAARVLGVPQSTIHDWLRPLKLTRQQYERKKSSGYNDTEIYRELRTNITEPKESYVDKTKFEVVVQKVITELNYWIHRAEPTMEAMELLKGLENTVHRIQLHLDQKMKIKIVR